MPKELQADSAIAHHVGSSFRLLSMLAKGRAIPAGELEEALGVSERTVRRYISALKASGFPIKTRKGEGYQLSFAPQVWEAFLPPEVLARLAELEIARATLPLPTVAAQTEIKSLIDQLTHEASGDTARVKSRLEKALLWRDEVPRTNKRAVENLKACLDAIAYLHPIGMTYTDHSGKVTPNRVIEPHGCLFTSGTWYCIGYCRLRKDRRNFALERMSDVQILSQQAYKYPEDFDIRRLYTGTWGIWRTQLPEAVEFIVDPSLSQFFIECEFPHPNKKRQKKDGRLQIRTSSADLNETARWLAPFGDLITVLTPVKLKGLMAERAERTLTRHQ